MALLTLHLERLCGSRQRPGHASGTAGRGARALARGRPAACGAGVQDPGAVVQAAKMIMRGSRVMNPVLGLRGLGMVGVSSGLHPAPFAGSQAGLRACFFGDFYPRHRLQNLVDGIIICKRHSRGSGVPGCDLARQPVLEVSMPYPQFCAITCAPASPSLPFSSHAIKAVFACALAGGAA